MFCAKCSYEYREGFYVCPDCKVNLVDKLPEKPFKTIETAPVMNKPIPKGFWIARVCGIGLFIAGIKSQDR
jgi:hypothetical protein